MELSDSELRILRRAEGFHRKRKAFAVLFLLLFLVCAVVAILYTASINREAAQHGLSFWSRFMPTSPMAPPGVHAEHYTVFLSYRAAVECAWDVGSCTLFVLMSVLSLLTLAALQSMDRDNKLMIKIRERLRELGEIG